MYKVLTLIGTRPELIKMSRVILELDKYFDHILVHSGQNYDYELNQIFFDDLKIRKPDYFLNAAGKTSANTIANIISKSDELFREIKPDALLLYGDTNTCLSVISAKRLQIPIFHMEAGNRCFDQRVPEELNRKIVDHLSDINLVLTEHARQYLIHEGIKKEAIIKTGSHMREVLNCNMNRIQNSKVLSQFNLKDDDYFVVSVHREENVDSYDRLKSFIDTIEALSTKYNKKVVVTTHPRTQKRINDFNLPVEKTGALFIKPLGFFDYVKLQMSSSCVISDSGTITEEASILNLPAVTIRNSHERPEGMDEGVLIMSGINKESILNSVNIAMDKSLLNSKGFHTLDYESEVVSKKIIKIVQSYIGYINRNVWFK